MTRKIKIEDAVRNAIISQPEAILDDKDVMQALTVATERILGDNIVDMRGIAMERLETRLDRLEDTHRSVVAAAYENVAGTNQVQRAVLRLLDAEDLDTFLEDTAGDVAEVLRIDAVRLVLELNQEAIDEMSDTEHDVLVVKPEGFVDKYLGQKQSAPQRRATLRRYLPKSDHIYGDLEKKIQTEACLRLDLGSDRLPGLLVLGSNDPHMFGPQQGADLLEFFAGVFEKVMLRWLS